MFQMNQPLPGEDAKTVPSDTEADGQAFMQFMSQVKGG